MSPRFTACHLTPFRYMGICRYMGLLCQWVKTNEQSKVDCYLTELAGGAHRRSMACHLTPNFNLYGYVGYLCLTHIIYELYG